MTSSVLASYQWLNTALKVLSMAVVLWLVNKDENSSYKLSWIILYFGVSSLWWTFIFNDWK